MVGELDTQESPAPKDPQLEDVKAFFEKQPYLLKRGYDYEGERKLLKESIKSPEATRVFFEKKLEQLAKGLRFESVKGMEGKLNVQNVLDSESADRAKAGYDESIEVFFHKHKGTFSFPTHDRGYITRSHEFRLFWARDANGNLIEIRDDFPHLRHDSISISDDDVQVGQVYRRGGPDKPMKFGPFEDSGKRILNSFYSHSSQNPIKTRMARFVDRFKS